MNESFFKKQSNVPFIVSAKCLSISLIVEKLCKVQPKFKPYCLRSISYSKLQLILGFKIKSEWVRIKKNIL